MQDREEISRQSAGVREKSGTGLLDNARLRKESVQEVAEMEISVPKFLQVAKAGIISPTRTDIL